jgi:hypothetical protein
MYYYCVNHNSLRIPRWRTSPRGVSAGPFVPRNGLGLSLFFEPIEDPATKTATASAWSDSHIPDLSLIWGIQV